MGSAAHRSRFRIDPDRQCPSHPVRARGRAQAEGVTGDVPVAAATPGGRVAAPATVPGLGTERTEPASLGLPLREAGIHLPRALGAISSSVKWGPPPLPLPGTPWVAAWVGAWVALSLIPARPPEAPSSPRGRSQTRSLCSPRGNLKPLAAASSFTRSWDSGAPGGSVDKASHPLWVHAGPPRGPPRAVLLEADSLKTQDLLSMEPEFFLSVLSIKPFLGPNGVLQSPCNFKGGICILWADPSGREGDAFGGCEIIASRSFVCVLNFYASLRCFSRLFLLDYDKSG